MRASGARRAGRRARGADDSSSRATVERWCVCLCSPFGIGSIRALRISDRPTLPPSPTWFSLNAQCSSTRSAAACRYECDCVRASSDKSFTTDASLVQRVANALSVVVQQTPVNLRSAAQRALSNVSGHPSTLDLIIFSIQLFCT